MNWRKIVGTITLILGLLLIGLYFGLDYYVAYRSQPTIIEEIPVEVLQENATREVPNHNEEILDYEVMTTLKMIPNLSMEYAIGQLYSPDIDMNLPILQGVNNNNMWLGAGTMRLDAVMGEGNYPLAGHYTYTRGLLFRNIHDVPIGTDFYVTDKETIYHYRIFSRELYPTDAVYMIENDRAEQRGNPILSLMVCNVTDEGGRIFAVGDLIDSWPYWKGIPGHEDIIPAREHLNR